MKHLIHNLYHNWLSRKIVKVSLTCSLVCGATYAGSAMTVTSEILGNMTLKFLGGADTSFVVPLHKAPSKTSTVTQVDGSLHCITISDGDMHIDEYRDSHYVRFKAGSPLEGAKLSILSNTENQLYVDNVFDYDFELIDVETMVEIIPHVTISDIFSSVRALPNYTELLYYDSKKDGIHKSPAGGYFYCDGNWYPSDKSSIANTAVIYPGEPITARVPGDANNDFEIIIFGHASSEPHNL